MSKYHKTALHIILILFALIFTNFSNAAPTSSTTSQINFLVLSDIHLDMKQSRAMDVNPKRYNWDNDMDAGTFDAMLSKINSAIQAGTIQSPDFILLLGDIAGYDRSHGADDVYDNEMAFFQKINAVFLHNTPIVLTFGNNDSLEKDYGAFYDTAGIHNLHSSYEIALANGWQDGFLSTGTSCYTGWTYPCLYDENTDDGYFATYVAPHLRLLSLNSVMFAAARYNTSAQDIADQQLAWLGQQLQAAAAARDYVLITLHVPFGNNIYDNSVFWREADQDPFYSLLSRYKNNIIGVFAGHTHMEELKVLQDTSHNTVGVLFFTAGLSTSHGNAPSVKSFTLNSDNNQKWSIANYETFNFANNTLAVQKIYDFDSYYCPNQQTTVFGCLASLTPNELQNRLSHYYSAGNPNYHGNILAPSAIFVELPNIVNTNGGGSSGNSSNTWGVVGATAAAVGAGAVLIHTNAQ